MKPEVLLAVIVALGATLDAQSRTEVREHTQSPFRSQLLGVMLPVPPLPTIGLPLPRIGLPPSGSDNGRVDLRGDKRQTRGPSRRWRAPGATPLVLFIPYAVDVGSVVPGSPTSPAPPTEQNPPTGVLWMDIEPAGEWQLFVDGYYVGTTAELGGGIELDAGLHDIEVRAPGYDALSFPVSISAYRSLTYRDTLKPSSAASAPAQSVPAAPVAIPSTPMTLYVIPGCYAGNVAPNPATLPKGCDQDRLATFRR